MHKAKSANSTLRKIMDSGTCMNDLALPKKGRGVVKSMIKDVTPPKFSQL